MAKKDRDTRKACFVEDLPKEWVEALARADYSHLKRREGLGG